MAKVIDLNAVRKSPPITALIYGASGSGKTRIAATAPDAVFLSDATERGYATVAHIPPDQLWTPGKYPEVREIDSAADMIAQIADIGKSGKYKTLIIDSLTFYGEMVQDQLLRSLGGDAEKNKWALYRGLADHLRAVMNRAHSLPMNIVWLALSTVDDQSQGKIVLPGKSGTMFPAAVNFQLFSRSFQHGNDGARFEIRTKQFGPFPAKVRVPLPDPLPEPTWRSLVTELEKAGVAATLAAPAPVRRIVSTTTT